MAYRITLFLLALVLFSACSDSASSSTDGDLERAESSDQADTDADPDAVEDDGDKDEAPADGDADLDSSDADEAEAEEEEAPPVIVFSITKDSHSIVLTPDASPSETRMAEKLRETLNAVLDADVPLLNEMPTDGTKAVVIGQGDAARALGVDPAAEELGGQGYAIRTVDGHLVIAGTPQAGTMYGVIRFLEDVVGVHWYAPEVTHVPESERIDVPEADRIVRPAFEWRHTSYNWPGKDDEFLANMGDNNGSKDGESEFGVEEEHDGRAHSYFNFISPDEYFDEHPEYFSEIGGVRIREETQLCLTNPDVLDIVTEKMLQRMADKPHVRQHNFSQMDHYNACDCEHCRAINEQYKTQGGTQFWFVNQLAERTSQVYPDKLIGTLAYMYTEEPPVGLEMHPNAAVWLCHMFPSCDMHPIATCPHNADYKRRAESWAAITDHLYIWHYIVDFMHYYNPFPNFRAMAADMRFYRNIGVEGIYLQGMGHGGGGGEWSLLRPYMGMHLLWNPDRNAKTLRRDWLQGYYGDAWGPLEDYIEMLHDKVEDDDIHLHLYSNPASGHLPDEVMEQANLLFDQAEAAVESDEELLERVRVARMPLQYAATFPRTGYRIANGQIEWQSEIAPFSVMNAFINRMEDHGFTTVREVAGDINSLTMLYMMIVASPTIETIDNGKLKVEVVPLLGGRALRIIHLASGKCVTAYNVKENLYFPFAGGLEDRTGELFRYYGWVEPAEVTERRGDAITLTKTSLDGWRLTRTMRLLPGEAVMEVTTEMTNPGDSAMEGRLRSHLELNLGDLRSTRMAFTKTSGGQVDQNMETVIENFREGQHFYDEDIPNGEWRFSGSKGLSVTQRFHTEELDFTWVYSYPETMEEVELELWSKRTTLEPGESIRIRQEIEITAE